MQPIVVNIPKIFQYVRNRFGVQTGIGRNAHLGDTIVPTFDVDPLLRVSRVHHVTIDVASGAVFAAYECPPGEFWHLKRTASVQATGADYTYRLVINVPSAEDPLTLESCNLTTNILEAEGLIVTDVVGITMRPGDTITAATSAYVTQGDLILDLLYELEDCSS